VCNTVLSGCNRIDWFYSCSRSSVECWKRLFFSAVVVFPVLRKKLKNSCSGSWYLKKRNEITKSVAAQFTFIHNFWRERTELSLADTHLPVTDTWYWCVTFCDVEILRSLRISVFWYVTSYTSVAGTCAQNWAALRVRNLWIYWRENLISHFRSRLLFNPCTCRDKGPELYKL